MTRHAITPGQAFHSWTTVRRDPAKTSKWICLCVCGTQGSVEGSYLVRGRSKQCRPCANEAMMVVREPGPGLGHLAGTTGADHPRHQGDQIAYATAHKRVAAARGRAREHACVICGEQASSWAYRGGSEKELTEWREKSLVKKGWLRYSPDPADYDPLCWTCHARKDVLEARARA